MTGVFLKGVHMWKKIFGKKFGKSGGLLYLCKKFISMTEQEARIWFYGLDPGERNRLSLKYRNTYGYGTFKDYVFLEIYNKEQEN